MGNWGEKLRPDRCFSRRPDDDHHMFLTSFKIIKIINQGET
ncbi:hypothetical protein DGo_PA0327 (plasmid) [Deinococcus gobiensis I-0]|uniref:Uncharacterized protein n=1 Tax=Deinococcus gobiensis (strain DSM 21396 / JCM 16679 / CGMCC 1.7299 / I-0) TaxID=745776 RepID=H8H0G1_DEIGI|nr:hypothetical protein DGo_PA0327 [Deinococcus gobiensis I-0]